MLGPHFTPGPQSAVSFYADRLSIAWTFLEWNLNFELCEPFRKNRELQRVCSFRRIQKRIFDPSFLPDFEVERNVKSEIGFVTLETFRNRV